MPNENFAQAVTTPTSPSVSSPFIAPRPTPAKDIGIPARIRQRLAVFPPPAGVTAASLAIRSGLTPQAWERMMAGERGLAGDEVVALAYGLQVTADWLLTGEDAFPVQVLSGHGHLFPPGWSPLPLP